MDITNLQVTCNGDRALATFDQDYSITTYKLQSAKNAKSCQVCAAKRIANKGFADKVSKELQFEKIGNQYQIVKELIKK